MLPRSPGSNRQPKNQVKSKSGTMRRTCFERLMSEDSPCVAQIFNYDAQSCTGLKEEVSTLGRAFAAAIKPHARPHRPNFALGRITVLHQRPRPPKVAVF